MLTFDMDIGALNAQIDAIKTKAEAAIRPAAQAGAQVFYDAVKASAPKSKKGHWFHGTSFKSTGQKYWFESGSLKNAVYQVYAKSESTKDQAVYQVAWNHRKVPYGFMVVHGTSLGVKGNDFIGSARKSVTAMAAEAMLSKFNQLTA